MEDCWEMLYVLINITIVLQNGINCALFSEVGVKIVSEIVIIVIVDCD